MVVDEVIVHRNDNVDITLAIPIESEPTTEDSVSVQTLANLTTLEPSLSDSFWTCSRILIPHCLGRRLATSGAGRVLTSRLDLFLGAQVSVEPPLSETKRSPATIQP